MVATNWSFCPSRVTHTYEKPERQVVRTQSLGISPGFCVYSMLPCPYADSPAHNLHRDTLPAQCPQCLSGAANGVRRDAAFAALHATLQRSRHPVDDETEPISDLFPAASSGGDDRRRPSILYRTC